MQDTPDLSCLADRALPPPNNTMPNSRRRIINPGRNSRLRASRVIPHSRALADKEHQATSLRLATPATLHPRAAVTNRLILIQGIRSLLHLRDRLPVNTTQLLRLSFKLKVMGKLLISLLHLLRRDRTPRQGALTTPMRKLVAKATPTGDQASFLAVSRMSSQDTATSFADNWRDKSNNTRIV